MSTNFTLGTTSKNTTGNMKPMKKVAFSTTEEYCKICRLQKLVQAQAAQLYAQEIRHQKEVEALKGFFLQEITRLNAEHQKEIDRAWESHDFQMEAIGSFNLRTELDLQKKLA